MTASLTISIRDSAPSSSAHDAADSGAISFGGVVKDIGKVASTVLPFVLKREEMARSFGSDFEKGFVDTLKTLGPIVGAFLKREEMEARSFGSDFEKGFVDTLKTLGPIVGAFLKREL